MCFQGTDAECSIPVACGKTASGYTAAMNQLAFGASSGQGAGDACGRCFSVAGSVDPHSPDNKGPFKSIVVKVTDMCSAQGHNAQWCGQTVSNPTNSFNQSVQCVISLFRCGMVGVLKRCTLAASNCARTRGPPKHSSRRRMTH